ncbi:disulfide bond formation protein B [Ferrimonas sp. SCSIO 43195]|uniref:disulfide bond formation protein B n=1 Tax=Ferrimonas sp. SCSIO 43195 TaxID=2822844 RepID=UPI002074B8EE|nr:disulfide bond formation protein B [Ferrimonas sp. SCSIO 43195]USD38513.1 disulfide bond formation protein B [Ferrimonas sp. SCSIO 43195]
MSVISKGWQDLSRSPLPTLAQWQNQRWLWLLMSGAALFLILSAMGYFQWFLEMDPCEICVYIRFSQMCILFAGLIIAIQPGNPLLKLIGLALAWYAVVQGMIWSIDLAGLHDSSHALDAVMAEGGDLFAAGGGGGACSTEPTFPLGLPMHEWFPYEFQPSGICGEDDWSLLGLNMAQYCIIAYAIFIAALAPVTAGWIHHLRTK